MRSSLAVEQGKIDPNSDRKYLPNSEQCFVCGETNPAGLKLRFFVEDGLVKALLKPARHHCGYPNVVHGGVVASAIDECMAWAATREFKRMSVTGQLTVRYIKRTPGDRPLTVCAEVTKANRRVTYAQGWIQDEQGTVYARGEGSFLPLTEEDTLFIDNALIYRGGEERVFDELREARQMR
jgi:uncharacterized protein (TIGR00369 family)